MESALPRFFVLYAAMYAAYGVASPFLPAFYASRGVPAAQLGFALGAATLLRLAMAPLAARAADRLQSLRRVLAACIAAGSAATSAYTAAGSAAAMIALLLLQAAALAPMTLLADALALGHARPRNASGFEYGWVRGAGSAAFIAGTLAAGQAIAARGLDAVPWMQAALLAVAVAAAFAVPEIAHAADARGALAVRGAKALLRVPEIAFAVLAAALVLGSHAMHDAFAMIRWREAGLAPFLSSVLWSEAVAAEVVVFFLAGPRLVARLRPSGAMLVAALAATIRWGVMASTAEPFFLALVQPLHGLTFALLHLACMRIIAAKAPAGLEATAQAAYVLGAGSASAVLIALSGPLYGRLGASAFWVMAALSAAAVPVAWNLRRISHKRG